MYHPKPQTAKAAKDYFSKLRTFLKTNLDTKTQEDLNALEETCKGHQEEQLAKKIDEVWKKLSSETNFSLLFYLAMQNEDVFDYVKNMLDTDQHSTYWANRNREILLAEYGTRKRIEEAHPIYHFLGVYFVKLLKKVLKAQEIIPDDDHIDILIFYSENGSCDALFFLFESMCHMTNLHTHKLSELLDLQKQLNSKLQPKIIIKIYGKTAEFLYLSLLSFLKSRLEAHPDNKDEADALQDFIEKQSEALFTSKDGDIGICLPEEWEQIQKEITDWIRQSGTVASCRRGRR